MSIIVQTIIREAAKAVGLWTAAPLLEDISSDTMKKFRETVSKPFDIDYIMVMSPGYPL